MHDCTFVRQSGWKPYIATNKKNYPELTCPMWLVEILFVTGLLSSQLSYESTIMSKLEVLGLKLHHHTTQQHWIEVRILFRDKVNPNAPLNSHFSPSKMLPRGTECQCELKKLSLGCTFLFRVLKSRWLRSQFTQNCWRGFMLEETVWCLWLELETWEITGYMSTK